MHAARRTTTGLNVKQPRSPTYGRARETSINNAKKTKEGPGKALVLAPPLHAPKAAANCGGSELACEESGVVGGGGGGRGGGAAAAQLWPPTC